MVWHKVDLHVRGEWGALNELDQIEDDPMVGRVGYAHGACLEVLILLVVEVVCANASPYAVCALEDMDSVTRALEV